MPAGPVYELDMSSGGIPCLALPHHLHPVRSLADHLQYADCTVQEIPQLNIYARVYRDGLIDRHHTTLLPTGQPQPASVSAHIDTHHTGGKDI